MALLLSNGSFINRLQRDGYGVFCKNSNTNYLSGHIIKNFLITAEQFCDALLYVIRQEIQIQTGIYIPD